MSTPPFSPVLVGGLLLRALPPEVVQPIADRLARRVQARHPGLFERLNPLGPKRFLVDVVDLPWQFLLMIADGEGAVSVLRKSDPAEVDATIRAPLKVLFGLLDGSIDGDAMFFTRDLVYEGDTEAVVALRNALDGADIDFLDDVAAGFGPLADPAKVVAQKILKAVARVETDMEILGDALVSPALRRSEAQQRRIDELEERCARLEKALRRSKTLPT